MPHERPERSVPKHPEALAISVVIPTYNRGPLVARAVGSVLRQSLPPSEVIVVDDGSQDDTRAQLAPFGDQVRYIYQDNAGSAAARNNGMRAARHAWVALLDSDDVWVETHLERMANAICATGGAANFYFADTLEPPDKGVQLLWEKLDFAIEGDYELREDGTEWVLMGRQPMMLQSTVFKREVFWACGGFLPELRYRDDTHMFLRLGLAGPVCAVAGHGVEMTSDDDPGNRLTLTHDQQERGTRMQVIMNRDLLRTMPHLPPETRAVLQRRLGDAHRGLARAAWRDGRWGTAVTQAIHSAVVDPRRFLRRVRVKLTGVEDGPAPR